VNKPPPIPEDLRERYDGARSGFRYDSFNVVPLIERIARLEQTISLHVDTHVHSNSTILSNATDREDKKAENTYFTHKFVAYVQAQDPEVFPVLEAIYVAGSSTDTIKEFCQTCKKLATTKELELGEHEGHEVGMSPKEFNRARNRLKQLAGMFLKHRNPIVKSS